MDERRPLCCAVLTGTSASRRDQPRELMESLKDEEAMLPTSVSLCPFVSSGDSRMSELSGAAEEARSFEVGTSGTQ